MGVWLSNHTSIDVDYTNKDNLSDILCIWLQSSIRRELEQSCEVRCAPSPSSSSTTPSDSQPSKSVDMPFRVDNPECLFVSALLKSSLQYSGILHTILSDEVLTIACNPAEYTGSEDDVQLRLACVCHNIITKLINVENYPLSFDAITKSLKSLTIGKEFDLSSIKAGLPSTSSNSISSNDEILFDKPNTNAYFLSLTALLFLRVLNPAIISPVEWGVFYNQTKSACIHGHALSNKSSIDYASTHTCIRDNVWYRLEDKLACPTVVMLTLSHMIAKYSDEHALNKLKDVSANGVEMLEIMKELSLTISFERVSAILIIFLNRIHSFFLCFFS